MIYVVSAICFVLALMLGYIWGREENVQQIRFWKRNAREWEEIAEAMNKVRRA